MKLTITRNGSQITGSLCGKLDTVNAEQFSRDMQPLMDAADGDIVLDCAALDYISSSGLRLFLTLRKQVASKGGKLTIRNLNEGIREVFAITGFFNLFTIE